MFVVAAQLRQSEAARGDSGTDEHEDQAPQGGILEHRLVSVPGRNLMNAMQFHDSLDTMSALIMLDRQLIYLRPTDIGSLASLVEP